MDLKHNGRLWSHPQFYGQDQRQTIEHKLAPRLRKDESHQLCDPTYSGSSKEGRPQARNFKWIDRLCDCQNGLLDVILGMKFLLEHKIISMASAKCLFITRSSPTIVQTSIKQSNRMKMISTLQLERGPLTTNPHSWSFLLSKLRGQRRTSPSRYNKY